MAPPTIPQPAGVPALQCSILGQASVSIGDTRLAAEGELAFGLSLYCGLNAGVQLARDAVAQLLWPTHDAEAARHCLRQLVYRLRALGVPLIANGETLEIAAEHVVLDVGALFTPEPSRERYLKVERFDVLADYAPTFSQPFSRWVEEMREQLGIRLRDGLMACIADARSRGRYREVSQLATHCLSLDPLNEEATLGLAEATALAGNKVRALQMLDAYRVDLGASPTLSLQTDLLRRRIAERLNVYGAQPDDVPMVGRDDAVEHLLRGLHAISSGKAQQLLIVGEAGVGKTRLLAEFQKIIAVHGVRTVALRCHPGWDEQPLTAITELARLMLQLPGALGCSPDALVALRELTGQVPRRSDAALYAADADAMLANLRWSVFDLFEAVMQERRLVLLVDNVQWLDALSESFLSYVLAQCAMAPLYTIMTVRDEDDRTAEARQRPLFATEQRLLLQPLDDVSARTLVHEVLEATDRSLPESAIDDCVRRCGGNPYFLSELARFFLVAGPEASAPVTLRTFIEFRLTKVSQAARRALQVVAILGAFSTIGRVRRVLQVSGYSVLNALEELQLTGLVQLENERCECRHDVVREIAEGGMSGVARRVLHLRAARTLRKEAGAAKEPALLLECGRHLLRSGDTARAPRGALILANRLLELGAPDGAEELIRIAVGQTADRRLKMNGARLLARSLRLQSKWLELISERFPSIESVSSSDEVEILTEVTVHQLEARMQLEQVDHAALDRLAMIAESAEASWALRMMAARVAIIAADGTWDRQLAQRVASTLENVPPLDGTAAVLCNVSNVVLKTMLSEHESATQYAESLLSLGSTHPSALLRDHCVRTAANCFFRLGYLSRARTLYLESLRRADLLGRSNHAFFDAVLLALISLQDGDVEDASARLVEARGFANRARLPRNVLAMVEIFRIEICAESGAMPRLSATQLRQMDLGSIVDVRARLSLLGTRVLQKSVKRRAPAADSTLLLLEDSLKRYRGCGWQDYPMFAYLNALRLRGDGNRAAEELREYLHLHRPERSRLRPQLFKLAGDLKVELAEFGL
ncbi:MAG: AAA family ATPase [Gemmatimonadaceae bacterium]